MDRGAQYRAGRLTVALALILSPLGSVGLPDGASAAPPLYWCPDAAPDRQYRATPDPGCTRLAAPDDRKKDRPSGKEGKRVEAKPPIAVENFQSEVAAFLQRYRAFLNCCATRPESLDDVEELQEDAAALLKTAQSDLFSEQMKLRGFTFREIIPPLARARDELRTLKDRLERIQERRDRLPTLDYEAAASERRRLQQEEEALAREFRPVPPPAAPRAGTEIGGVVGSGPTTLPNRIGPKVGNTTLPGNVGPAIGPDQSGDLKPRTGTEARVDLDRDRGTTLNNSTGTATGREVTGPTSLPNTTGFEVGTEGGPTGSSSLPTRAGPAVGDSSLNSR